MYTITIHVDNRALGDVLEKLEGMKGLVDQPTVKFARGAIVKNGKAVNKAGNLTAVDFIAHVMGQEKMDVISSDSIRQLLESGGFKPSGCGTVKRHLIRHKLIGPVIKGRPGVHHVLNKRKGK